MLEIGSTIGGMYKILHEVGKGGMSVVYMALNEKANQNWAVKVIRKDGGVEDIRLHVKGLTADEKEIILDGCLMNYYANRAE